MSTNPPICPPNHWNCRCLPLRDVVVFPHMVIPLFVGRPKSIKALETAMEAGKSILLVAQKSAVKDEPSEEDLYQHRLRRQHPADAEVAGRHREGAG
jgi:ATP-dependent Lon protease